VPLVVSTSRSFPHSRLTTEWKVHNGKIENDPEQLAHTSDNSPALSLSETDSGPVESESSQTGATKSDLEPSVSTWKFEYMRVVPL
jgi:hypothetical protein